MSKLRLFAKKDIQVVESFIKTGQEIRIGKISPRGAMFLIICSEDNLHKWCDIKDYNELIEHKLIEDKEVK